MSKPRVLVTGGAGFIGSHLITKLVSEQAWEIVVLDLLIRQIHPSRTWVPPDGVTFVRGDVCSKSALERAMDGVEYIVHLAAETGVGQSAYEVARYVKTNEYGTAVLLERAAQVRRKLKGIILASSRAVYGEGRYACATCGMVFPELRKAENLATGNWEHTCQTCRQPLSPLPAIENQPPKPTSIYGITKLNQEQLLRQCAENYGIPAVSLRFQNVYGPHQALNNPYTGILAIFSTRIRTGNPIYIYEDGKESRDFVYVQDVVDALRRFLRNDLEGYSIYNVGSGKPLSVLEVASLLVRGFGKDIPLIVSGKHRMGDIRHAWASIEKISRDCGYAPSYSIEEGLQQFIEWVNTQPVPVDNFLKTEQELSSQGLLVASATK